MKVSVQYAREHFEELLTAAENGIAVEVVRAGKPTATLSIVPQASRTGSPIGEDTNGIPRPFGFARGLIWLAPDWDSDKTNAEIAAEFENSEIFPPGYAL